MVDAGVWKMLGGCFDNWLLLLCGSCRGGFGSLVLILGMEGEVVPMVVFLKFQISMSHSVLGAHMCYFVCLVAWPSGGMPAGSCCYAMSQIINTL